MSATKKRITKKVSGSKSTGKTKVAKKLSVDKKLSPKKYNSYTPYLKNQFTEHIIPSLMKRFGYKNVMQVPRITGISINMGIGDAKNNPKTLENALKELTLLSGQKAVVTRSRKDISNFKIRKGFPVGCKVMLRGNRMFDFFERLISIALPRTRDFNGLSFKSFDRKGNYSFGVKEQIIFTEIDYDKIDSVRGMDISIITTATTDDEAYWLLKEYGFPLRDKPVKQDTIIEAA